MRVYVPIKLPSLANTRMHWRAMAKIKQQQRRAVKYALIGKTVPPLPLTITITRIGARKLDDDNLRSACKYVRDQIAEFVGVDDGSTLYTWRYDQRTAPRGQHGIGIEIAEYMGFCQTGTAVEQSNENDSQ